MKNHLWLLLSIVWAGAIFYLSFFNPLSEEGVPWFEHQDKLGHFVFYAILAMALIKTFSREIVIRNPLSKAAVLAFSFGILIELGQHYFTHNREGSFMDALANGLGILAMVILMNSNPKIFHLNSES
jgi:VanZ family protein